MLFLTGSEDQYVIDETNNAGKAVHSDSLDTLLYVRFAIQKLEFYEWKLGDRGWALS